MSEAYLIDSAHAFIQGSPPGTEPSDRFRPVLEALLEKTGVSLSRVQEIHWLGGEGELVAASVKPGAGPPARFEWPDSPLLAHFILHACSRSIAAGARELIVAAQVVDGQAVALLLGSPVAVGRYNLIPRLRFCEHFSLQDAGEGLVASARSVLEKAGADPAEFKWIAAGDQEEMGDLADAFPMARWLENPGQAGDLFLVRALTKALEEDQDRQGLLLSRAAGKSGLATWVERI